MALLLRRLDEQFAPLLATGQSRYQRDYQRRRAQILARAAEKN